MVEKILPGIYRIIVPLTGNPLGWVNSYVIKGRGRSLLIDTGLNKKECLDALQGGLRELEVDLKRTDLYITHNHADHYALAPTIADERSTIYLNRPDKENQDNWSGWARSLILLTSMVSRRMKSRKPFATILDSNMAPITK
jgi:glyoxylase-like metal-dependent hydrolase (beta-lactamase superfamily II)